MASSYRVRANKSLFDEIDEIADALKDTMLVMVQNDMAITDDDLDLWRTQTQAFIERLSGIRQRIICHAIGLNKHKGEYGSK